MKRLIIISIGWMLAGLSLGFAQNGGYPWGVGIGSRVIQYKAHPGDPKLAQSYYDPTGQIMVSHYLNPAFDFRTQVTIGPGVRYPAGDAVARGMLIDMNYLLAFKLHNGVLLRESARFSPYLLVGVGGSYLPNRPDAYLPFGGGVRVRLGDRMSINLETVRQISVNRDYQHLAHAIAFVYNLDTEDEEWEETIPNDSLGTEELLAIIPVDFDQDGTFDQEDLCPDVPGPISNQGCPEDGDISLDPLQDISQEEPVIEEVIEEVSQPTEATQTPEVAFEEEQPIESDDSETSPFTQEEQQPVEPEEVAENDIWIPGMEEEEPNPMEEEATEPESFEQVAQETAPVEPEPQLEIVDLNPALHQNPQPELDQSICESLKSYRLDPIYFGYDSDQLTDEARQVLDDLAGKMKACPDMSLVILGHSDADGQEDYNLVLSVMRAYHVKYYLVYEHGIRQARITSDGIGEEQPVADNSSDVGKQKNRRVDFKLIP